MLATKATLMCGTPQRQVVCNATMEESSGSAAADAGEESISKTLLQKFARCLFEQRTCAASRASDEAHVKLREHSILRIQYLRRVRRVGGCPLPQHPVGSEGSFALLFFQEKGCVMWSVGS